jgi:hypothetical protein
LVVDDALRAAIMIMPGANHSRSFDCRDESRFPNSERANYSRQLTTSQRGDMMLANLKRRGALAVLACMAVGTSANGASAVTAEIAKKCEALTAEAYPPAVPGNPAAGTAKGTGPAKRKYYASCVAHGGNMASAPENMVAGEAVSGTVPADSGGRKLQKKEHDYYKPCPASVAINGRNLCLGLK